LPVKNETKSRLLLEFMKSGAGAPPSIAILAMADETRAHMRAFESPESWEHWCLPIPKPISPALELARNSQGLSNPS
jgi:hypothetical protein